MVERRLVSVGNIPANSTIVCILIVTFLRIGDGIGLLVVGRQFNHCARIIGSYHGKLR